MPPSFIHNCDVIVVNYNAGKLIGDCVASALKEGALRVIVVDNGSANTESWARQIELGNVEIVPLGDNFGIAHALNVGITREDLLSLLA